MTRVSAVFAVSFYIWAWPAYGQLIISTFAGSDWVFLGSGGLATAAPLGHVSGIVYDSKGNLYISDSQNHLILKVDPNRILTVAAGNGIAGFSGDGGSALRASLLSP